MAFLKKVHKIILRKYLFMKQSAFLMNFTPETSSRYIQEELEKAKLDNLSIQNLLKEN